MGLLVIEAPPGASASRHRFLARSRIVAALSGASVIVEAGFRSGAKLVADEAARLPRPVGAVPGPVTSAVSSGTNRLIADGAARLVTNADDITALLNNPQPDAPHRSSITAAMGTDATHMTGPVRGLAM